MSAPPITTYEPNTHFSALKTKNLPARAFAPANISLIFETYPASPPHGRGSLGVGITLDEGVVASVHRADAAHVAGIFVDGKEWKFPTVENVLAALGVGELHIALQAAFQFGCGFGMSGASALSVAYATNALLKLGRSEEELGMIAHDAEVAAATGLGDVGGQFNGGIMIKTMKYQPLTVAQLPVQAEHLYVRVHGPIHTADVIGSQEKLRFINSAGHQAMADLEAAGGKLTLGKLFDVSLEFARHSGLLTSEILKETIADICATGGHATMIMLGEAIVATVPFAGSRKVRVLQRGVHLL